MRGGRNPQAVETELWSISAEIDGALRTFVDKQPLGEFYELMRYELGWRTPEAGPALKPRAVLCVLACECFGGAREIALPMAMAVSLLHNFARIQEDVERQRELGKGRPAVWKLWGTPQAMNAGDGMHALAKMALLESRGRVPASVIVDLEEDLDERCLRVCEILHQELLEADPTAMLDLVASKSAVLFGCAAYAGCYLAGADKRTRESMRRFGEIVGSAAGVRELDQARAEAFYDEALSLLAGCGVGAAATKKLRGFARYLVRSGT